MDEYFKMNDGETITEYCHRIAVLRETYDWTWHQVAKICNEELNIDLSAEAYRSKERKYKKDKINEVMCDSPQEEQSETDSIKEVILDMKKERVKLSDERTQNNAIIRRISREETIKEIAKDIVDKFDFELKLPTYEKISYEKGNEEAILLLSDWHYGIEIDNYWNKYNPDIAKERLTKLRDEVVSILTANNIGLLHVINLGDLISGRIHNTIRINNRIDVITQTIEVSELLSEFLNSLSEYVHIEYHDTADNHSRIEPNLKDSLDLESLTRITGEFLKLRLKDNKNIEIFDNVFGDDIATFNVCGHKCVGVHGNKDKTKTIIDKLTMLTKQDYQLVVSAHLHHFNADEQNETIRISNGSLMGTDDFAVNLRLNSKPSQTLIISDNYNVVRCIFKLDLE